jgi:RNase P subunit RPR2
VVDPNEMHDAMHRALEEIHNDFCNSCKEPFIEGFGKYADLVTTLKIYRIWYCDNCWKKQEEEND